MWNSNLPRRLQNNSPVLILLLSVSPVNMLRALEVCKSSFWQAGLPVDQGPSTYVLTVSCLWLWIPTELYGIRARLTAHSENKLCLYYRRGHGQISVRMRVSASVSELSPKARRLKMFDFITLKHFISLCKRTNHSVRLYIAEMSMLALLIPGK